MDWNKARLIIAITPRKPNQIFVSDRDLATLETELGDTCIILEIESVVAGDDAKLYKILFCPITHISDVPDFFEESAKRAMPGE